ncbi:nucleotidyltransferase domain-containing protein [Chryseobacterium sp. B21-037]|uniref:nucleotidyltransferase domain-containing protein n=1 Tax=Chryseobacterium sp. B21-037 TaxID=2926038 RepID=UPI002358A82A|nr:nucleotidyltransferase domain-containing protein [Chryseobacterium sp. B21-037]MDC8107111.1 nucleotidyltransferase domain-containing protein [Chryseobacterium sp. B21-037]
MIQVEFANKAKEILQTDETIIGLAVGGSWISDQMDEFSDLDLIIVTEQKVTGDKNVMIDYAKRLGNFLSAFTGEHVGEPRLLICLYDNPLLHVDLKFVTLEEFHERVETPTILLDKNGRLQKVIDHSVSSFPYPDYQWIEDRFWIWIHYALLKVGRGEYFEAFDFLGFLRMSVFGPLLHIKNNNLPRGVRKVETDLDIKDLEDLKLTLPQYNRHSLLECLHHSVLLYRKLRNVLFGNNIILQDETEKK